VARPIRVAVVAEPPGGGTDQVVAAVVRKAADALAEAGYDVVDACPPRYEDAFAIWAQFLLGDYAAIVNQVLPLMGHDCAAAVNSTMPPLDATAMSHLFINRHAVARAWSEFLAEHPLVLTPTWTQLPFEHGFDVATPQGTAATMEMIRPVVPANLLGLPSACVPAGRDAPTGLPVGVLITGRRFREDLCLDAAEAIEARPGLATPIDPAV